MTSVHFAGQPTVSHPVHPILGALARTWWLILLRGICAVEFGFVALLWPGVTLVTLVILYGAFALADGVLAIAAAMMGGAPAPRWWLAIVGLAGIGAGVFIFAWPAISTTVLLFLIAAWAIASGIVQIAGAIRLRRGIEHEWLLGVLGVLSVAFGLALLLQPGAGMMALTLLIGGYAVLQGVLLAAFALRLRRDSQSDQPEVRHAWR